MGNPPVDREGWGGWGGEGKRTNKQVSNIPKKVPIKEYALHLFK